MSEVVDVVVPEFQEQIVFISGYTDDKNGRDLAKNFRFQYIPTSFFINSAGEIVETVVGPISEQELRLLLLEL